MVGSLPRPQRASINGNWPVPSRNVRPPTIHRRRIPKEPPPTSAASHSRHHRPRVGRPEPSGTPAGRSQRGRQPSHRPSAIIQIKQPQAPVQKQPSHPALRAFLPAPSSLPTANHRPATDNRQSSSSSAPQRLCAILNSLWAAAPHILRTPRSNPSAPSAKSAVAFPFSRHQGLRAFVIRASSFALLGIPHHSTTPTGWGGPGSDRGADRPEQPAARAGKTVCPVMPTCDG